MRIGVVILPEARWRDAASVWQRAEELGFDHAWTYDHLAWRTLRDSSWFGAIPVLTAASLATTRIRLGPLVASANFRHPVSFAKELVALDDLSGGRVSVGLGAGSDGWDASMLGGEAWSRRERAERFEEFVAILDGCLLSPQFSYAGDHYSAVEARMHPGCVQEPRVPFVVAGIGPRGMTLAARYGATWVTTGPRSGLTRVAPSDGARIVRRMMENLDAICAREGRDPASLDRMVLTGPELDGGLASRAAFDDAIGAYGDVGVTDFVVHWPRPDGPFACDIGAFESIFAP
jgi:alkanesulfonate monooxygenase SsuD/methylene tetrahydromethanopterin reductase-like flavin-dependent oxidoreductase (luciferase family)